MICFSEMFSSCWKRRLIFYKILFWIRYKFVEVSRVRQSHFLEPPRENKTALYLLPAEPWLFQIICYYMNIKMVNMGMYFFLTSHLIIFGIKRLYLFPSDWVVRGLAAWRRASLLPSMTTHVVTTWNFEQQLLYSVISRLE